MAEIDRIRWQCRRGMLELDLVLNRFVEQELAGLVCYQKESFNYVFGVTKKGKDHYIVLARTENGKSSVVASRQIVLKKPIQLKVTGNGDDYTFNFSTDGMNFENLGGTVSGDILSTNIAGGFTGQMIGLYATTANDIVP